MTVLSTSNKMAPQAMDGAETNFPFTFRALVDDEEAIKAVILDTTTDTETELVYNGGGATGYTVSIDTDGVGGSITVNDARSADYTITVYRDYDLTQESNYADYNPFPAETTEDDYDKGTMIDQQLQETLDRTLTLPITVIGVDTELPFPEADKPIGWNSTATGLTNDPALIYRIQIDLASTPDFLGTDGSDGVLRTGTGITMTEDAGGDFVTIAANAAAIDHDALLNFVADEHIAHSGVTLTAGTGLAGGGDITASRSFSLSHLGIEALVDPNADRILFWDDSAGATDWLVPNTGLGINLLNLNVTADYSVITANDGTTDITATEMETLTDGSVADALHTHTGLAIDHSLDDAYDDGSAITVDTATISMTVPDTTNIPALTINQNDSSNNPVAVVINNAGTGLSLDVQGAVDISGKLTVGGLIDPTGLKCTEQAADPGATGAGEGTFWVKNTTPSTPFFTDDTGADFDLLTAAGGANVALSNLAGVAINTSLVSDLDNTDDLGSAAIGWASLYLSDAGGAPATNGEITYNTANNRFEFYQNGGVSFLGGGGGSADSVTKSISQANAFAIGDVVYNNAGTWTLADASAAATAEVIGIVSATGNPFTLTLHGYISAMTPTVGFTAGTVYFVSETGVTNTTLTATEPTISKPVFIADTASSGYFNNMRGLTGGGSTVTLDSAYEGGETINVDAATPVTLTATDQALSITSSATTQNVLSVEADSLTSGNAAYFTSDSANLGSGVPIVNIYSNSASTLAYELLNIENNNPAASNAISLRITHKSPNVAVAVSSDATAQGVASFVGTENLSGVVLNVTSNKITSGSGIKVSCNNNTFASGQGLVSIQANGATSTGQVLKVSNISSSASAGQTAVFSSNGPNTECVNITSSGNGPHLHISGSATNPASENGDFWREVNDLRYKIGGSEYTIDMTIVSDKKAKKNKTPTPSKKDGLMGIEVVDFQFEEDFAEDTETVHTGMVAQDVQKIFPEFVRYADTEETILMIDYKKFIPVLIKVAQEQQAEINELRTRIEALEGGA